MIITIIEITKAGKKLSLYLRSRGRDINKLNEGITSQKILYDNWEIFSVLFVSMYSQIKAITETKGIEAKIPPQKELLLLTSEIATIRIEEIITFII